MRGVSVLSIPLLLGGNGCYYWLLKSIGVGFRWRITPHWFSASSFCILKCQSLYSEGQALCHVHCPGSAVGEAKAHCQGTPGKTTDAFGCVHHTQASAELLDK